MSENENKNLDTFLSEVEMEEMQDDVQRARDPYEPAKDYIRYLESLPRRLRRQQFKLRFSDVIKKQANLK